MRRAYLLNAWMVEQDDIPENWQAAIRRLIAMVCGKGNRNEPLHRRWRSKLWVRSRF
jgi:hypothetical protein